MTDDASREAVAPLSVETDLTARVDGVELSVASTGERLLVGVESLSDAVRVARSQPTDRAQELDTLLRTTDLTVEVRVRDRIVGVVGSGARPGAVSRALELSPVEVRLSGVLGAVAAEIGAAGAALAGN